VRVVSDTSPLCYLLLIEKIAILPALFERVLVPRAVAAELSHPAADRRLQEWIAAPPAWLEIRSAPRPLLELGRLGPGEIEAITLAESVSADLVILDERKARQAAVNRGLEITGLLGILADAADKGLIDLADTLANLGRTNFRADPRLFKIFLDKHGRPRDRES
jgi:predicted nucleic acid-binding protein